MKKGLQPRAVTRAELREGCSSRPRESSLRRVDERRISTQDTIWRHDVDRDIHNVCVDGRDCVGEVSSVNNSINEEWFHVVKHLRAECVLHRTRTTALHSD